MNLLTAPLYGVKHIEGLLFVAVMITVLFFVFPKYVKNERTFYLVAMILFYVFELAKLGYLIIEDGSFPMNHLPFHLCSLPLYTFPILYFVKNDGWFYRFVKSTAYGVVLIAGITALAMPFNIIGSNEAWFPFEGNFLPLISFIFHGLMIFVPLYMVAQKYITLTLFKSVEAMAITSILMVMAMIMNALLDKDYMLLNTGNGSPLVFLRDISQLVYTGSMILLGYFMIFVVFAASIYIPMMIKKLFGVLFHD